MRSKEKGLTLQGSQADAKTYALKLLSFRSRSRKELQYRLKKKGFSTEQIDVTILFLERAGLINDENLAAELLRYSSERKSLGAKGIKAFLVKRGIDKELIHKALTAHTQDIEEESAKRFVEKKLKTLRNYPEEVIKRRLLGMLQRRGFSTEVIRKVMHLSL